MIIDTKHPLLAMPMNGVSDINLAIAVTNAGAFPSISIFNFYKNNKVDFLLLSSELKRFQDSTSSSKILISMHWETLFDKQMLAILYRFDLRFIELFIRPVLHPLWNKLTKQIEILRKQNFKIFFKTAGLLPVCEFDAIVIKGPNGAGRSFLGVPSLTNTFNNLTDKIQANKLIPSGGIGCPEQVAYYLNRGVAGVGVGTLIAASEESCLSAETKQKIVESSAAEIQSIGPLNCRGLFFSHIDHDDENNSNALSHGIRGINSGCIYVGNGIDYIDKVMPLKDIIQKLISHVGQ